ncbi:GNAT family N-acetyltransferase [Actinokineospora fastidiosa]|uniref:GNAT family N-acetyltransferase n=1 Tax=Actinokineospora fastidiosa TaxID=1816 RepID=A0A918GMR2_9PSEU|nr:GNAT family N-acetyltransferase [Actinokineospora fastidiosa]GGS48877.1 GNAT family N-acetyltransferase [Actinokineospora fastidiosa]
MTNPGMRIRPYTPEHRAAVLDLSIRAWASVFPLTRSAVPAFVYDSFYPHGWEARQLADLSAVLDGEPDNVDLAFHGNDLVGWACTRLHPEDHMGELYVLAVHPAHQRRGVGTALMARAAERARTAGMRMLMAETGDDPGHAPARAAYERAGFQRWPVARYFKELP